MKRISSMASLFVLGFVQLAAAEPAHEGKVVRCSLDRAHYTSTFGLLEIVQQPSGQFSLKIEPPKDAFGNPEFLLTGNVSNDLDCGPDVSKNFAYCTGTITNEGTNLLVRIKRLHGSRPSEPGSRQLMIEAGPLRWFDGNVACSDNVQRY